MIKQIKPNIYQLYFQEFGSAVYLIQLNNKNILIDTSSKENKKELIKDLKSLGITILNINIIILTHSHYDHIENNNLFSNAKIYNFDNINQLSQEILKQFQIIKTPGHTKDSIAILYKDILFSGDTLFYNGIGKTNLPESQPKKMQESLNKLKNLNYKILCPGHIS